MQQAKHVLNHRGRQIKYTHLSFSIFSSHKTPQLCPTWIVFSNSFVLQLRFKHSSTFFVVRNLIFGLFSFKTVTT